MMVAKGFGRKRAPATRQGGGQSLAEMGPAMFVLFVIVLCPLINLISLGWGVSTVWLAANVAARSASTAATYRESKANMIKAGNQVIGGPFGAFGKIIPGNADGLTLSAYRISTSGGQKELVTPGPQNEIDEDAYNYELAVEASYDLLPVLNFAGSGVFDAVPFLGKPFRFTCTSSSHVEHPHGLTVSE